MPLGTSSAFLFLIGISVLAAVADPLARLMRLPLPTVLVLIGVVAGQAVEVSGFDSGFRYYHFNDIVLVGLLPPLVFLAGLELDLHRLRTDAGLVTSFSVFGVLAAALITATALYYGIDHPTGFPWAAALLTGAILAATDPGAVLRALRRHRSSQRVDTIIESEGLFNDAGAVVVFTMLLAVANGTVSSAPHASLAFLQLLLGGAAIGAACTGVASALFTVVRAPTAQAILSIALAYGAYLAADLSGCSGVIATLVAAIALRAVRGRRSPESLASLEATWQTLAYMGQAALFLLVGFVVTVAMFRERWLAMLIGIAGVLGARVMTVYALVGLRNWVRPINPIPLREQTIMVWAGTRGAVALVLALSLPTSLPYWWTIQSIAFGVVLFSVLLQAPLIEPLLRTLAGRQR